jgi:very-short-patch-repair endonuclease
LRTFSVGLVVEVDGGAHHNSRAVDRQRDEQLQRLGHRVVRVEAALVMRDSAAALAVVRAVLT